MSDLQELTTQAFDTAPVVATGKTPALTGISRTIPLYTVPQSATKRQKLNMMMSLALCSRSNDEEVDPWHTLIGSYLMVAFEDFAGKISGPGSTEYELREFPESFMTSIDQTLDGNALVNKPASINFPEGFPTGVTAFTVDYYNAASVEGAYGFLGLLVFLMGKRVTDKNRESIEKKRPENLIATWKMVDEAFILTGAGKLSRKAQDMIPHAWFQAPLLRDIVIREFIAFRGSRIRPLEVAGTLFNLLEHSGMQGAVFCHRLIKALPWVKDMPLLRADVSVYQQSVLEYLELDAEYRPYVKLLLGSGTKIFHTKSMARLVACATLYVAQDEPSVALYNAPGGEAAKKAFVAEAKRQGLILKVTGITSGVLAPAGTVLTVEA